MTRYRQQLFTALFNALMKYSDIHEYSWAAPGRGGGVGHHFKRLPVAFITIIMAKPVRSDIWGLIERTARFLLDHTGAFGESENAPPAYSVLKNRSGPVVVRDLRFLTGCVLLCRPVPADNDNVVVLDRNCHKSIPNRGYLLILAGRNRYIYGAKP